MPVLHSLDPCVELLINDLKLFVAILGGAVMDAKSSLCFSNIMTRYRLRLPIKVIYYYLCIVILAV